ncbi:MAG TPA: DUF2250 domain-containing protein [candidate division Zixibacteria bacterium]|nr:DUF2250 domain-containing protein [candidate division Zixibacteria bacterium]
MFERLKVKDDYVLAKCCSPQPPHEITGYFSHDGMIRVHSAECDHLSEVEPERLLTLSLQDVLSGDERFVPESDYATLNATDFAVLAHHERYGLDYSLVVARKCGISKQDAFDRHRKLLDLKLIERVEPRIIQYRKGIVDGKWIKHRNHTYYDLTKKGKDYLVYSRHLDQPDR